MNQSLPRRPKPEERAALMGSPARVIATAFFLFAIAFLGLAAPLYWSQWKILRTWPQARATVVQSRVITRKEVQGQPMYEDEYALGFSLNDRSYVVVLRSHRPSTDYASKARQVARLPQGSTTLLRYNPADPADVRMQAGYNIHFFRVPMVLTFIGFGFALVGGILWFLSRRDRRKDQADAYPEIRQRIA